MSVIHSTRLNATLTLLRVTCRHLRVNCLIISYDAPSCFALIPHFLRTQQLFYISPNNRARLAVTLGLPRGAAQILHDSLELIVVSNGTGCGS